MGAALQRAWLRRGPVACALWPASLLYRLLVALRRVAYRSGVLRSTRPAVPVVVIGNVVAGGAGKTPVVLAVLAHLSSRGIAAGVVSRGYGREAAGVLEVRANSTAQEAGDEPLLLARQGGCPVFVAAKRADAARALLEAYPATRVIVSDDGLQHLALARDIEVCVFDSRGAGNGWLLPAGPLREPWPRHVDLVVQAGDPPGIAGHAVTRRLARQAVRADGSRIPVRELRGATAVAGIANPEAFFTMLGGAGVQLDRTVALPDHHAFGADPAPQAATLVCTEKDAVKLWRVRPDAWAVPLEVSIAGTFWHAFDCLVDAKLSSAHGPETA
jgi:tetraacyldisaccharide 4'-kinase